MANKPKAITDFFKPRAFTIPKNRIPRQDEDDEIIVASSSSSRANTRERTLSPAKRRAPVSPQKTHQNDTSTVKRGRGRPRKDNSTSPSKLRMETPVFEQEGSRKSTPTRRSPRKQLAGMDEIEDAPPDSSGLTSVRSSLKSTPTKSRTLEAVEIPSPAKHSSPSMPAPSQIPAHESKKTVNTSFSSFSSLTGMSSQSSSRRIVKNGVQAVTNSDSASMSSSSSDDELVDLESFAPRKKRKLTPPIPDRDSKPDLPSNSKPTRSSTRLSDGDAKKRVNESWRPSSPPPTNRYKHSLLSMVKQSAKEAASEAKIAQAEADMREAEQWQKRRDNARANAVQTKSMAKEFAQDSEDEERIEMAIERTEVLRGEETFYFFRGEACESMQLDLELDTSGLEFLQDDAKRRHACTSGFLVTVASQQGLPEQLVSWLHNEIFHEPSEEFCESYVAIMGALVKEQHHLPALAFSLSETHPGQTLRDVEEIESEGVSLPPNLKYALMVTAALAPHIAPVNQACALAELILLNNDEHVREDMDMQIHIERAMCSILESHSSDENLQTVYRETTRQILHASSISRHILSRAIASIPATILPLHQLRRKLSLHILLDASIDEDIDTTSPTIGLRLLQRLKKHASFHISETTDYVTFHSLIDLIDIAVDVGFSDFAFLSSESQPQHKVGPPTKSLFGHTAISQSPAETTFNAQIDDLVSRLRSMGSKIRDAGTSHLKRTEAKSALERLVVRLEAAVRTKPKLRKGVFDRSGNSASAMKGFLKRVESQGEVSNSEELSGILGSRQTVQAGPGKQHKVTWRDDVVGNGVVGAGADVDGDESLKEGNGDDDDGDDDDSM
jgi:hypothetical protein